jgi:diacylglycerol kinase
VSEEFHRPTKIAKDVAAGMVLVGAMGAVIVGAVIFLPYIISAILNL